MDKVATGWKDAVKADPEVAAETASEEAKAEEAKEAE